MDKRIFVVFILGLFVIGFVSATSVGVSESEFTEGKVVYTSPTIYFVNSTAYVNASEWWITNEGNLDNVADLLLSMFSLTWIDTDIDMVNNGLLNVGDIDGDGIGSYFNSTLLIDGDMAGGNATLVIEADSSHFACINMTEGNNIGMQICYDGAGANRAFVISNLLDGNEYFWIDRTTGLIHFNNDTVAVSLITETINSTDWSNASSALNGTFVPYTGAVDNVDFGIYNITTTGNFTADYGFFNYLGSVISRITKIFASALDVDGDVNITGFLNVSKNITTTDTHCFNADCSAKIYHNGTGLIIES